MLWRIAGSKDLVVSIVKVFFCLLIRNAESQQNLL